MRSAAGVVHERSDRDLAIIKDTSKRPIDLKMEVCGLVKREGGLALFIYTPQEFEYLKSINSSLIREIQTTGKVLYEARDAGLAHDRA